MMEPALPWRSGGWRDGEGGIVCADEYLALSGLWLSYGGSQQRIQHSPCMTRCWVREIGERGRGERQGVKVSFDLCGIHRGVTQIASRRQQQLTHSSVC